MWGSFVESSSLWMLSYLVAQVLLDTLLVLLILRSVAQGFLFFRTHNLIDDADLSSPFGPQDPVAM